MRYRGQGFELAIELPPGRISDAGVVEVLRERFESEYEQRYGYASRGASIEATTWKVTGYGERRSLVIPERTPTQTAVIPPTMRPAYFPETCGYVDTAIYRRDQLHPYEVIDGPAIVEDDGSTSVIPPGCTASVDTYGSLVVSLS
jgi:N-methylhydantoinase A/oxoprolinase/acetone carboxylase beta subunit